MQSSEAARLIARLPNAPLPAAGPVSRAFRTAGLHSCQAAALTLWQLPYGRNDLPEDPLCVLSERRGTCSTKHALLKRLFDEQELEGFQLHLAIYEMSEANTPGVGRVLDQNSLPAIPEAHCFLTWNGSRLDITRVLPPGVQPIEHFFADEVVAPSQITGYKRSFHREYLSERILSGGYPGLDLDALWRIREECIAALSA